MEKTKTVTDFYGYVKKLSDVIDTEDLSNGEKVCVVALFNNYVNFSLAKRALTFEVAK